MQRADDGGKEWKNHTGGNRRGKRDGELQEVSAHQNQSLSGSDLLPLCEGAQSKGNKPENLSEQHKNQSVENKDECHDPVFVFLSMNT